MDSPLSKHHSKDRKKDPSLKKKKKSEKSKPSSSSNHVQYVVNDQLPDTAFETMYPIMDLPIAPKWSENPLSAFQDLMDTLVMRYVPQLSGVLITHNAKKFFQGSAGFNADSAFATVPIGFECTVWRPRVGQKLEGTISLSSPSHVSLLLYGIFNASIPASHLSDEDWEFVIDQQDRGDDQGLGYWKNRLTQEKLGGLDGKLTFTVISMTVANHMLSLHGSLLQDPFSVPVPTQDASYLKKSLHSLPSQPNVSRTTQEQDEKRVTPRRVRWQDQDDSDSDVDVQPVQDQAEGKQAPPCIQENHYKKGTKRKSSNSATDEKKQSTSEPTRDKKRRKKDKQT